MSNFSLSCHVLCQWGRQVTIPPSYLDIGMGGHFKGFGGCEGALLFDHPHIKHEACFS